MASMEEKNKSLVLEAFDTLSTSGITRRSRDIGRRTTSSTAPTSSRVAKVSMLRPQNGASSELCCLGYGLRRWASQEAAGRPAPECTNHSTRAKFVKSGVARA